MSAYEETVSVESRGDRQVIRYSDGSVTIVGTEQQVMDVLFARLPEPVLYRKPGLVSEEQAFRIAVVCGLVVMAILSVWVAL
jgi:hypothetical protein